MRKWTLATLAGMLLIGSLCLGGCAPKYKEPEVTTNVAKPTNDPPPAEKKDGRGTGNESGAPAAPAAPAAPGAPVKN